MKVFLSVDMEGSTGLERTEELFRGMPGFAIFRQVMAGDANAVIQGAIEAGADEIVVSDSHAYMCNMRPDDLVPGVTLRRGQLQREWCQMKGFDASFDAVIQIGYHAKAGSSALLSHTWVGGFKDVRVNGQSVPETSLNGYLAAAFGVPVVMVAGDDQAIAEGQPVIGDIHYAQVKTSLAVNRAKHLPIDQSRTLLRNTARAAIRDAGKIAPLKLDLPVTIELDLSPDPPKRPADNFTYTDPPLYGIAGALSDVELVLRTHPHVTSPRRGTVSFTKGDYLGAYRTLYSILGLIYERDLENLLDAKNYENGYQRADLDEILYRDYPLNEIGPRRDHA